MQVVRPGSVAIFAILFLAACAGTSPEPSVETSLEPTLSALPSATSEACPSVLTGEGSDPEPIAPPETVADVTVVGHVELPSESMFVAASPDAIWATSPDGFLWRIDPATGQVADTVNLPDLGFARPAYGLGSLWVAEMESGRLLRLDPANAAVQAEIQLDPADRPMAIAFTADDVLVANQTANVVTVIDAETNTVATEFDLGEGGEDRAPASIATGEGVAWVVEHRADSLATIDLATGSVTRTCIGTPDPGSLAAAGDLLWVADAGGVVSVVDRSTGSALVRLGLPAVIAGELALDEDFVWVAGGSALVGIDITTRTVAAVGALGDLSAERQFAGGASVAVHDDLWVTDPASFGLLRLKPG